MASRTQAEKLKFIFDKSKEVSSTAAVKVVCLCTDVGRLLVEELRVPGQNGHLYRAHKADAADTIFLALGGGGG